MKRIIAVLSALVLTVSIGSVANAKGWTFERENDPNLFDFGITEGYTTGSPSQLTVYQIDSKTSSRTYAYCRELGDQYCTDKNIAGSVSASSGKYVRGDFVAGVCTTAQQTFCIEDVRIHKNNEPAKSATFIRDVANISIPASTKYSTPEGKAPTLWEAPGVPHQGADNKYSVYVMLEYMSTNDGFVPHSFTTVVSPYTEVSGEWYEDPSQVSDSWPENIRFAPGSQPSINFRANVVDECVWQEKGKCGQVEEFTDGTRVGLTIRMTNKLGGFFNGRLKSPNLSVSKYNASTNKISIDAESVEIGKIVYQFPKGSEAALAAGMTNGGSRIESHMGEVAIPKIEKLRKFVGDKTAGQATAWRASISVGEGIHHPCFKKPGQFVGLVTTNSAVYEGGTPKMISGFLNYNVAGMHYESDGVTKIKGSYDLILRSDVARCLYGFGKAPLSATVSVAGGTDKSVATTVVSEKNGWLKMAAYGFTFSKKTIKVKIIKKKK